MNLDMNLFFVALLIFVNILNKLVDSFLTEKFIAFSKFPVSYIESKLKSKRSNEVFFCDSCGSEFIKWMGKCPSCQKWNSIKSFKVSNSEPNSIASKLKFHKDKEGTIHKGQWLVDQSFSSFIDIDVEESTSSEVRHSTFSNELNRVLGGGLVKGSVTLMAGEPGVGKSTFLLQLSSHLSSLNSKSVLYVSGEENFNQIAARAKRLNLNVSNMFLLSDTLVDNVIDRVVQFDNLPALVVIDSIQTMRTHDCPSGIGSVTQIRECTAKLIQLAKTSDVAIVLTGHVTKSGDIAGPRVLEHMVDAVLNLEISDQGSDHLFIKGVKNRYGSTSEIGVVSMTNEGLRDVLNPSELFVSQSSGHNGGIGSAVAVINEGTRSILTEIQCLVGRKIPPMMKQNPKRTADGFPFQRLSLIIAVLEKRQQMYLSNRDVFVKSVGGLRVDDPTADLALAISIVSSLTDIPIQPHTAFVGELGLGGEIRNCKLLNNRIQEAAKLGFKRILVPGQFQSSIGSIRNSPNLDIQVFSCRSLAEAIRLGLTRMPPPPGSRISQDDLT